MGVTTLTKAEIYEKYADQLIRFATGLVGPSDGRDVVSAAVVNAMWSSSWDSVVYERAYLYKAVLNAARMRERSGSRRRAREARAGRAIENSQLDTDVEAREWLDVLSVQQRAAIHLAYWEDLPAVDIAQILGVGEGTVRRHLARGRAKLRKVISDD